MNLRPLILSTVLTACTQLTLSQAPGVTIYDQSERGAIKSDFELGQQAEKFFAQKIKVISPNQFPAILEKPSGRKITLPKRNTDRLPSSHLAEVARQSSYRVGWLYLCKSCDHWHVDLAGGYAVTHDGIIATCAHVLTADRLDARKGMFVAVDRMNKLFPVTEIVAYHEKIDGALIKIDAKTTPLPFNDHISPGDEAFCFSDPLGQGEYFSRGIVNRFFWDEGYENGDPASLKSLGYLKLNVSSRWAPGSSGSAVLDAFGNAIGHVSGISSLSDDYTGNEQVLIHLHRATPARSMVRLAQERATKATVEALEKRKNSDKDSEKKP